LVALRENLDCIRLVSVDSEEERVRPGDSFVDDTPTGETNNETTMDPVPVEVTYLTQSEDALIGQMQITIQFFLDLLQVTGGDSAPDKCVWFLICHR
jgi:hypothetical protein